MACFSTASSKSGSPQVANLILRDVAALAALGRAPILCALADMQRLVSAASAAVAPQQQPAPNLAADHSADAVPGSRRRQARVQRPVRRPGGGGAQQQQQQQAAGSRNSSDSSGRADKELRLAGLHLGTFLLPWANEQSPSVFVDVAQAAADEWQRWRCVVKMRSQCEIVSCIK